MPNIPVVIIPASSKIPLRSMREDGRIAEGGMNRAVKDRGFRNHLDFVTFYHEFCERYGKKIVSVGEAGLDMSTPMGRMFAGILVQFAEWELQTIGERRRAQRRCGKLGSVQQDVLNEAIAAKLLEVIGKYELTEKRLIEGDDHSATLKRLGMQIADLTTQHYVNNGVPDFHKRMQELEAEHARVSALPREKPKVRKIATGKTFRQHWEEMDDEQWHAYLKSAGVHVLVVRKEDYTARKEELAVRTASEQGTQAADDLVLDIPMNVVTEAGGKYVANIGLGTLREQLQHVAAA